MNTQVGRISKRPYTMLAALGAAVLCACLSSASSAAEGSYTTDSWMESVGTKFVDNQDLLTRYVSWIVSQPESAQKGYVKSELDTSRLHLTVWWNRIPANTRQQLQLRAEQEGISLTIRDFPYTRADISVAQDKIARVAEELRKRGFALAATVGIPSDGAPGLVVEGSFLKQVDSADMSKYLSGVAGMPVRVRGGIVIQNY